MKLSTAISLGAMLGPQNFKGGWVDQDATCALAGAADASGILPVFTEHEQRWNLDYEGLSARYPMLDSRLLMCPEHGCRSFPEPYRLWLVIAHLNDVHAWSRERIADWVATIEAQHETPAEQPQPVVVEA